MAQVICINLVQYSILLLIQFIAISDFKPLIFHSLIEFISYQEGGVETILRRGLSS